MSVRKKRKITVENILRDGILSPPKIIKDTTPTFGNIIISVPSTSRESTQKHTVSISVVNNKYKFSCSCSNNFNNFGSCKHITTSIIQMMLNLIKKQEQTDDTLDLINSLEKFSINSETDNHMDIDY